MILRKQRIKKDYWDEYEDFSLDSSFEELNNDESNLDHSNSNGRKEEVIKDHIKRGKIYIRV